MRIIHGHWGCKEYRTWDGMVQRTNNPNHKGYKNYGAKGVKVCRRWREFKNFLDDMGYAPTSAHTIDRKDNKKGYYPGNCRWVTRAVNNQNGGRSKLTANKVREIRELNSKGHTMRDLASIYGIDESNISRICNRKTWSNIK